MNFWISYAFPVGFTIAFPGAIAYHFCGGRKYTEAMIFGGGVIAFFPLALAATPFAIAGKYESSKHDKN
jgi:hypothetical protein